jgi:hypothetical protein
MSLIIFILGLLEIKFKIQMYHIVPKAKNQVLFLAVILEFSLKTARNQRIKKPLTKALEKAH